MSAALLDKILKIPRRIEPMGGQNYSYVTLEDVVALVEQDIEIDLLWEKDEIAHKRKAIFMLIEALGEIYQMNGKSP